MGRKINFNFYQDSRIKLVLPLKTDAIRAGQYDGNRV